MKYIELYQNDLKGAVKVFKNGVWSYPGIDIGFHTVDDIKEHKYGHILHNELVKPKLGNVLCEVADNGIITRIVEANYDTSG